MYKNESQSCRSAPLAKAGLLQEDSTTHPVCPVRTLKSYLTAMTASHSFQVLLLMFVNFVYPIFLLDLGGICVI